jgi:putative DNA primase/helicase
MSNDNNVIDLEGLRARKLGGGTDGDQQTPRSELDLRPVEYSDEALALRFTGEHAADLRYVAQVGKWFVWDGTRFKVDETLETLNRARAICRAASHEALQVARRVATKVASKQVVAAVESLARADRAHAAGMSQFDADPWSLNTPAGIVDLRTGTIRAHDRAAYCTKITAVGPGEGCPTWLRFLDDVTAGNAEWSPTSSGSPAIA